MSLLKETQLSILRSLFWMSFKGSKMEMWFERLNCMNPGGINFNLLFKTNIVEMYLIIVKK